MASSLLLQVPLQSHASSSSRSSFYQYRNSISVSCSSFFSDRRIEFGVRDRKRRKKFRFGGVTVSAGNDDATETQVPISLSVQQEQEKEAKEGDDEGEDEEIDPQALEYVNEIKRVLELLRKNRDMLFSEVKLTVMIEDPREVERRRLLGIEDPDAPTRDDLAEALEQVNEGKVPKNRLSLRMLYEEMINWPNLEVEALKKTRGKSLYAKTTDTGVNPREAAKRLNIDWDSAAEINDSDAGDDSEVPAAVGYSALYLVTAFPVIIGISVVLILFYNSLQ